MQDSEICDFYVIVFAKVKRCLPIAIWVPNLFPSTLAVLKVRKLNIDEHCFSDHSCHPWVGCCRGGNRDVEGWKGFLSSKDFSIVQVPLIELKIPTSCFLKDNDFIFKILRNL